MKRLAPVLVAGLLALVAPPLAPADEQPASSQPAAGADPQALFQRLDANADGVLAADEVGAEEKRLFERLVRKADRNSDGKLDPAEFAAGLADQPAAAGPPEANRPQRPGANNPAGQGQRQMLPAAILFRALDTNADGALSAEEIAAASESLKKLDRDGDGAVTRAELFPAGQAQPDLAREQQRAAQMVQRLKQFDKDGDGKISRDEAPPWMQQLFAGADTDGNGLLEAAELLRQFSRRASQPMPQPGVQAAADAFLQRLQQADRDGDGKLSPDEAPERLKPNFSRLDANADGFLDQQELKAMFARAADAAASPEQTFDFRLKQLDSDGDGKISRDEAPAPLRERFAQADGNGDGFIEKGELRKYAASLVGQLPGGLPQRLKALDKDGDGKLSQDEAPEPLKQSFQQLDRNSDGFIDATDLAEGGRGRLRKLLDRAREGNRPQPAVAPAQPAAPPQEGSPESSE